MSRVDRSGPSSFVLLAGSANRPLARHIAGELGEPLGRLDVSHFSDGELNVELIDGVRGRDVFLIQPTGPPVNETLMELLVTADACRRASANSITAVTPYLGYARRDRRPRAARMAIGAKLIANMIQRSGIDRLLTTDLHAEQAQGFFDIPVDNIYALPVLLGDAWKQNPPKLSVVSPDVEGVARARAFAKRLDDADLAIIDDRGTADPRQLSGVIGEVADRTCLIVDDIVDTGYTLCAAVRTLKCAGAASVVAYVTHPVLSELAVERIAESELAELVVTDSIPLGPAAAACAKIRQLSIAGLLAETIRRMIARESLSSLNMD